MKVLVIGSGGREHSLVWKLSQSDSVTQILWAPGNPAAKVASHVRICPIKETQIEDLALLAENEAVTLTVVGPEGPLVLGISDEFRRRGLTIFGPSKAGAQLEGSKVFSKKFFLKHNIPTGKAKFFSDVKQARTYALQHPKPLVVKADGLAGGKGVLICQDDQEVLQALHDILELKVFGDAGREVLIEEFLSGPEVSVQAITDGQSYRLLAPVQDHKRALDDDEGLNTGGMGTYSPTPIFTPELEEVVRTQIFDRTLDGLKAENIPYCGVLYAGLMLTKDGPKILEYNCRFGDPETQVIMARLESDLGRVLLSACKGELDSVNLQWKKEAAICVVLAAQGYPAFYQKGDLIDGLEQAAKQENVYLFHAGTQLNHEGVVTAGGRVLGVTALGNPIQKAIQRAYQAVDLIQFKGKHFRRDIAAKALS